jgi:hypothetical protein
MTSFTTSAKLFRDKNLTTIVYILHNDSYLIVGQSVKLLLALVRTVIPGFNYLRDP